MAPLVVELMARFAHAWLRHCVGLVSIIALIAFLSCVPLGIAEIVMRQHRRVLLSVAAF